MKVTYSFYMYRKISRGHNLKTTNANKILFANRPIRYCKFFSMAKYYQIRKDAIYNAHFTILQMLEGFIYVLRKYTYIFLSRHVAEYSGEYLAIFTGTYQSWILLGAEIFQFESFICFMYFWLIYDCICYCHLLSDIYSFKIDLNKCIKFLEEYQ